MSNYKDLLLHVSGLETAFSGLSFSRSHKAQGTPEKADRARRERAGADPADTTRKMDGSKRRRKGGAFKQRKPKKPRRY